MVNMCIALPTRPVGFLASPDAPCDHPRIGVDGEMSEMGDWISGAEAADIIGVHRNTVLNSLKDDASRAEWWGVEDVGWRRKPLSTRGIYQVSEARARELAKQPPATEPPDA